MENVKILQRSNLLGREFTIYGTAESPLFLAKDVAEMIGHSDVSKMVRMVDDDEKVKIFCTLPSENTNKVLNPCESATYYGTNRMFVTEDGLYEILMQSNLPIAKEFKKGVKKILKSIRKNGAYMTEKILKRALAEPDYLIQLATQLKEERNKRHLAEQKATEARNIIIENQPKISFANAILSSETSILIGELAKILTQNGYKIGERKLFQWLRNNHYLGSIGERYNIPNQEYVEMGLFDIKQSIRTINDMVMTVRTIKVTPKGQQYFINKLCKMKQLTF